MSAGGFESAMRISASGLTAQSLRFKVAAENLANAGVTGSRAGAEPYARKTVSFATRLDGFGAPQVSVSRIARDRAPFPTEFRPGDPAADAGGLVKMPNVNPIIELADIRDASNAYQANLQVIKQAREAISLAVDLLRT